MVETLTRLQGAKSENRGKPYLRTSRGSTNYQGKPNAGLAAVATKKISGTFMHRPTPAFAAAVCAFTYWFIC